MLPMLHPGLRHRHSGPDGLRKEDGLTSIFELLLLELLPASPQPLTIALQHPASPVLASLRCSEWLLRWCLGSCTELPEVLLMQARLCSQES